VSRIFLCGEKDYLKPFRATSVYIASLSEYLSGKVPFHSNLRAFVVEKLQVIILAILVLQKFGFIH
jgi:hypothetical protein